MYVCMYVCMCECIHVHMCGIHECTCVYIHVWACCRCRCLRFPAMMSSCPLLVAGVQLVGMWRDLLASLAPVFAPHQDYPPLETCNQRRCTCLLVILRVDSPVLGCVGCRAFWPLVSVMDVVTRRGTTVSWLLLRRAC